MPTHINVPTIETERLRLRSYRPDDLDDASAMYAAPEFTRHVAAAAIPREEVWTRILRYVGQWAVFGYGIWAVEEKATARFAGEAGFACLKRDIVLPVPCEDAPEAGWGFAPWAHGKGFATEAVRAAHTWLDAELGLKRTVCIIRPANVGSVRVASKCGYEELDRVPYGGIPILVFGRTATG